MKTAADTGIQSEGRLLYTLLDAADDAGRLSGTLVGRWRDVKSRIVCGSSLEDQATLFHTLLIEIETSGALKGTWIEERWRGVQSRIGKN